MDISEVIRTALNVFTPLVWGVFILLLNRLHNSNVDRLVRIEDKINHLDSCMDGIKDKAIRSTEFDDVRARVTRLENRLINT